MENKYFVYILETNDERKRFYIGQTSDLEKRIDAHERGSVCSTKNARPLSLVYFRSFNQRSDAMKEETRLKNTGHAERFLRHTASQFMAPSSRG